MPIKIQQLPSGMAQPSPLIALLLTPTILIKKDLPIRSQGFAIDDVTIGSDCWLGAHVCVLKGSSIRDGAVIGAGAVVKGLIPENAVAVGVPAKVIKQRE